MKARKSKAQDASPPPGTAGDEKRPEVMVDFLFDQGLLHVVVENVGDAAAYRVSIKFDKKFHGLGGQCEVSSLRLFRCIEFLAPRKRIATFLDTSNAYFQRREPTRLTAVIAFRDAQRRAHERQITHDLSIYKDMAYLAPPGGMNPPPSTAPAVATSISGDKNHGNPERKTLLQFQLPH